MRAIGFTNVPAWHMALNQAKRQVLTCKHWSASTVRTQEAERILHNKSGTSTIEGVRPTQETCIHTYNDTTRFRGNHVFGCCSSVMRVKWYAMNTLVTQEKANLLIFFEDSRTNTVETSVAKAKAVPINT